MNTHGYAVLLFLLLLFIYYSFHFFTFALWLFTAVTHNLDSCFVAHFVVVVVAVVGEPFTCKPIIKQGARACLHLIALGYHWGE